MYGLKNTKENRLKARALYIPEGAEKADYPEIETVVYTFINSRNKPSMMVFTGTASKPIFNYYFSSEEKRAEYIQKFLEAQQRKLEYKAKRKEENKGTLTGSAATAKSIREHLKREFPEVKFSVKSSNFAGGDSVDISWTDGPVCAVVELITAQYQAGSFDGMTDCYNYRNIDSSLGCPGAKYVHCHRTQSEERKAELEEHCISKYGQVWERYSDWGRFNAWRYENEERDTWEPKYRARIEDMEERRAELYEKERQERLAEIEKKDKEEGLKQFGKVVSLVDYKKRQLAK